MFLISMRRKEEEQYCNSNSSIHWRVVLAALSRSRSHHLQKDNTAGILVSYSSSFRLNSDACLGSQ
ncbi:hypothetical protein TorRG33x02_312380 [Trema orientale]|uniref:Uncharacterized protein n=1 Tax=Trema orientale TaxID=63057 RepID=A0A2P5BQE9_TREOI|nr:hypothetical protein TorRG33x02_312380 [Trema orientale]